MMNLQEAKWTVASVRSPHINAPVEVIAAKDIHYIHNGHRFQTVSLYVPKTPETSRLLDTPVTAIPATEAQSELPQWHVHIHGGAWRDPQLTSASIEADVAHAFSGPSFPITAIASINYTLSPFPTHPILPYDPVKNNHSDPSREAVHPQHVRDVLSAFQLLRSLGLTDGSYILSGHSCGACLVFQSILAAPQHYSFADDLAPPCPAALLGMNGLYDLDALVDGLGPSHQALRDVYDDLLAIAFGADRSKWAAANAAKFDTQEIAARVKAGHVPRLVVLDQSDADQLVPMNQAVRFEAHLRAVDGLRVVRGKRCTGKHAAPWEEGIMIWESITDILELLAEGKRE